MSDEQNTQEAEASEAPSTAPELIEALATYDREQVNAVLAEEQTRPRPRSTVIKAAEDRLRDLSEPLAGEPIDSIPEDEAWAQLLDGDGNPVLVDGKPVRAELVP